MRVGCTGKKIPITLDSTMYLDLDLDLDLYFWDPDLFLKSTHIIIIIIKTLIQLAMMIQDSWKKNKFVNCKLGY